MSWEKFCELYREEIAPRYQLASKDKLTIADDEFGSYRHKIESLVERPRSVLLMGEAGRGKTHFMMALMRALFESGKAQVGNALFYRATTLDNALMSEFEKWRSVELFVKKLAEPRFLFIDDFGLSRDTSRAELDYYDLIDRRTAHERITVFSTNLNERALARTFGERISSRLRECAAIEFNGPDLRGSRRL